MSDTPTIWQAIAKARAEIPTLVKSSTNPFFSNKDRKATYVSLENVLEAIEGPLANNGLVLLQPPCVIYTHDGARPGLRTLLVHVPTSTEIATEMLLQVAKEDPQGQGAAITFARRFAIVAFLSLNCEEDDDGNKASGRVVPPKAPVTTSALRTTSSTPQTQPEDFSGEPFLDGAPDLHAPIKEREPSKKQTGIQIRNEAGAKLNDNINEQASEANGVPSRAQQNLLFALMRGKDYDTPDKQHAFYSEVAGRPIHSYTELTRDEISGVISLLKVVS